jgi:3-oxoacyl-[acyl-carrier protein] reductase
MDLGITHKRALITGAGRGIGRSITLSLAEEGVHVAYISRTKYDLEEIENLLKEKDIQSYMIQADLSEETSVNEVSAKVLDGFGPIDILINNLGGTLNVKDPFCSIEDWRRIWRINVEVAIEFANVFMPSMINQKWGRVINIASIAGLENQGPVPYCTMKAALVAYTRSMGRVLAPDGVIMASILPGAVFTQDGYWDITSKTNPEHVKKYLDDRMAIHRFGTLEEISKVVTFFCSQYVSFCVGSTIPVDGGQGRCFF